MPSLRGKELVYRNQFYVLFKHRDTGVQERFPETARGGPGRLAGRQRRGRSVQGHGRRARPARRHIPPRATPPPAALGLLLSFSGKRPQTPAAEGRRPRTPRATGSLGNGNFGPRRRRRSPARLLPPLPALRRPQRSPRGAGRAGQGGPDGARRTPNLGAASLTLLGWSSPPSRPAGWGHPALRDLKGRRSRFRREGGVRCFQGLTARAPGQPWVPVPASLIVIAGPWPALRLPVKCG